MKAAMALSEREILKQIERQPKHAAGYKQLVREMGLHGRGRRDLEDHLKNLIRSRQLVEIGRDRYALPKSASSKNLVTGRLTMHRDGFGFVIPDSDSLKQQIEGDIYVSPMAIG